MVKNLKLLREEKGISQQSLAKALIMTQQSIYKYEKGLSEPDINTLVKLSEYFDVSIDFLVGITEHRERYSSSNHNILSSEESKHMYLFRQLPHSVQININNLIESILSNKYDNPK